MIYFRIEPKAVEFEVTNCDINNIIMKKLLFNAKLQEKGRIILFFTSYNNDKVLFEYNR